MEMKVSEFVKRARKYAKENGLTFNYDAGTGKGSHGRITVGSNFTTIKGLNKTIRTGLFHAMCKQLGIDPRNF